MWRSAPGGDLGPRRARWSQLAFWLIAVIVMGLIAILLVRLAGLAWTLTAGTSDVAEISAHGQLVPSRMGYLILQGDELAQVLGSAVLLGVVGGGAVTLGMALRKRRRRRA